jgi:hypothetical protein
MRPGTSKSRGQDGPALARARVGARAVARAHVGVRWVQARRWCKHGGTNAPADATRPLAPRTSACGCAPCSIPRKRAATPRPMSCGRRRHVRMPIEPRQRRVPTPAAAMMERTTRLRAALCLTSSSPGEVDVMSKGLVVAVSALAAVCVAGAGMLWAPPGRRSVWLVALLLSLIVGTGSVAYRAMTARRFATGAIAAVALLFLAAALLLTLSHRQ